MIKLGPRLGPSSLILLFSIISTWPQRPLESEAYTQLQSMCNANVTGTSLNLPTVKQYTAKHCIGHIIQKLKW